MGRSGSGTARWASVSRLAPRSVNAGPALLSEALVGYHGSLSDNYGYKQQELADLLNGYLEAARNR